MRSCTRFAMLAALWLVLPTVAEPVYAAVSRVGSWTTGLAHTAGAGANRVLLFAVGYEDNTDLGVTGVTFGGQALTRIAGEAAGTTIFARSELWYLGEAGIAAATTDSFVVTWGGATPMRHLYGSATYAGVDQTSPLAAFDSTFANSPTPNPLTLAVTATANSYVVASYYCGSSGTYAWNNSFVAGFEQAFGNQCTMSGGDLSQSAAGSVVVSATHSNPNRHALAAAVLAADITNQPPVLAAIGPQSVNEGANLNFGVSASDADATTPSLSTSALPANATFNDNGDGTGTFDFTPDFTQAGSVDVTFYATDGTDTDSELVTITVTDSTPPPVTISGSAGVPGTRIAYGSGPSDTATADGSGLYSFSVPYDWSGTVTPILAGYQFSPASRTYANVISDQVNQDYSPSVAASEDNLIPNQFELAQNYPNPFNPTTTIHFTLPTASYVTVEIFNSLGRRVRVLVDGFLAPGGHLVEWDGMDRDRKHAGTGIYFYRLQTAGFVETKKMLLLK